eukprot:CAMPEP_0170198750 /NCGR_PEP_ID=MMETSP0040_2-20121228/68960_1 /TAXON_ID=641309 /ORGANISM="Lotharella oceanica, Strain CCMP622" /LENGTH=116 /DNA_ID=CAMNT_0010448799 /DNA_START=59 /DNA_END=409 /DNA_ORIENTATION=-
MIGHSHYAGSVTSSASIEERLNQQFASLPIPDHGDGPSYQENTISWLMRESSIATQSSYTPSVAMVQERTEENDTNDNDDEHADEQRGGGGGDNHHELQNGHHDDGDYHRADAKAK